MAHDLTTQKFEYVVRCLGCRGVEDELAHSPSRNGGYVDTLATGGEATSDQVFNCVEFKSLVGPWKAVLVRMMEGLATAVITVTDAESEIGEPL